MPNNEVHPILKNCGVKPRLLAETLGYHECVPPPQAAPTAKKAVRA